MQFTSFCGGSYVAASILSDQERTINWYPDLIEVPSGTARVVLTPTPGATPFAPTTTAGPGRGLWSGNTTSDYGPTNVGRVFVVSGNTFYEIDAFGTAVVRGTVALNDRPATISWNGDGGNEVFVTSGGNGYIFDLLTNTFTQVLTGEADIGASLHGYFLALSLSTGKLRISDLLDGTTWDPLQFVQRSLQPDPWQAMAVTPFGFIALIGTRTGEFWYDAGSAPFPFAPHMASAMSVGVAAPFSMVQVGSRLCWLGLNSEGGYAVYAAEGFTPERISTFAIEREIGSLTRVTNAQASTYSQDGHRFYVLTFPTDERTFVYDLQTQLWHERASLDAGTGLLTAWRGGSLAFAYGKQLVQDRATGAIWALSPSAYADVGGGAIRRIRRAPVVFDEHRRVRHRAFELTIEPGLMTLPSGQPPKVWLRWSDDFGRTFGNEHQASIGKLGEYKTRCVWRLLGTSRARVYEVGCADAAPFRITGAAIDADPTTDQEAKTR